MLADDVWPQSLVAKFSPFPLLLSNVFKENLSALAEGAKMMLAIIVLLLFLLYLYDV